MLRSVKAGLAVAAVLAAAACATTTFQATWKAPEVGPLNLSGAKVAALVMSADRGFRLPAEVALAEQITAQGAVGIPAHTLLADELTREENQDKARAELEKAGVKGIVAMRVVDSQQRITSTPSTFWVGPPYSAFWGRPGWGRPGYWGWGWGWGHMHAPTVRTDTVVSVETLIFSMPEDRLVWVGTSQTTNPSNVGNFVRELSGVAARELRRQGLIQYATGPGGARTPPATGLRESSPAVESQMRLAELSGLRRLEPRIRATARRLVEDLLAGWEQLRAAR